MIDELRELRNQLDAAFVHEDDDHVRLTSSVWFDTLKKLDALIQPKVEAEKEERVAKAQAPFTNRTELCDDDEMPFGKHKGERLGDVPDSYFRWYRKQDWADNWPDLLEYAELV